MEQRFLYQNVKDLQELLGLSANGLKLYEKEGVISPRINKKNGYREMSHTEGVLMATGLLYTKCGLTLRETASLLQVDAEQQMQMLEECKKRISNELINNLHTLNYLTDQTALLGQYTANPLICRITKSKKAYFLPVHGSDMKMLAGAHDSSRWAKNKPFSTPGILITMRENKSRSSGIRYILGPTMWAADAERLSVPLENAILLGNESRHYVQGFVSAEIDCFGKNATYDHIWSYIDEQNLTICGDSLMRTLTCEKQGGQVFQCTEIRVPVKKADGR